MPFFELDECFSIHWRPDGRRTSVNDAYCRYYGMRRDDALAGSVFALIEPEHRDDTRAGVERLREGTGAIVDQHRAPLPGGGSAWQQWFDLGVYDADGRLHEIQSIGVDLTAARDEALGLAAGRDGTEALASVGRIAVDVVHDLRNLLMVVLGNAQHALESPPLRDPASPRTWASADLGEPREALERTLAATDYATTLANSVLGIARPTHEREPTDLAVLIADLASVLRCLLPKSIDVVEVTPPVGDVVAIVDRGLVERALLNLALNARDAMPQGGSLTIALRDRGSVAELVVEDTGVGLSSAAVSPSRDGACGFGLRTVRRVAREHSGAFSLEPAGARGTRAAMTIPLERE